MSQTPDPQRPHLAILERLRGAEHRRYRQIYCTRDLNLANIPWIGFDMDYTLAIYHREPLDALCFRLTLDRLVTHHGYPDDIRDLHFDPHWAIRGLVIDRRTGHVLKMDNHRHVGKGTHGFRPLDDAERAAYRRAPPRLGGDRFLLVDTLFELPEAYLYAALLDRLLSRGESPDFARLAADIRNAIDRVHADGEMKRHIREDLPTFIQADPDLAATLHRFRSAGKKLFLMTNSHIDYTDAVLSFVLKDLDGVYGHWSQFFDVVITAARKPSFFRGNSPFIQVALDGTPLAEVRDGLQRGAIYQHGNLADFERSIGLGGEEILYVGDHIYGDILRSKVDSNWRTVMVIPEMEDELRCQARAEPLITRWNDLETRLHRLNDALTWDTDVLSRIQLRLASPPPPDDDERAAFEAAAREVARHGERLRKTRRELVAEILELEQEFDRAFHPRWGSLFKEGNEHSLFGAQVENYACLYTSRVSNFFSYSPMQYFRSPRNNLPHEAHG